MQVFGDSPGDGYTIVSTRAAPDFVHQHQTAVAEVVEDAGRFGHLDHEGTLAPAQVVAGPHPGEHFVNQPDVRRTGGNKAPHLRHQHDERRLSQQRRLARHIRAGDDDDLLGFAVQEKVVRDVAFAQWQLLLDHCVATVPDVEFLAFVDDGLHVVILPRHRGERTQRVQHRHNAGILLNGGDVLNGSGDEVVENPRLDGKNPVFGVQDFLFVFFQFGRDVALGVDERLLANPLGRHLAFVGVAHFQIVAKHLVEGHFQGRNARALDLAFLDFEQVVFARESYAVEFVEFGIDPALDHAALSTQNGRIVAEFGFDFFQQKIAGIQLVGVLAQDAGRFFGFRFALFHRAGLRNGPAAQHLLDGRDL